MGVTCIALYFALAKLLRPSRPEPTLPTLADLEAVRKVIENSAETYANLALSGDKTLLFSENKQAFMMYAVQGRTWVSLSDPIGPKADAVELMWRFRELCDQHDGRPVFYDVKRKYLPYYLDLGLTLLKTGEEARISLKHFSIEGGTHKKLRYFHNRLEKEGCQFELTEREHTPFLLPELKHVSDAWLTKKRAKEKRFSLGFFDSHYLQHFPTAVVRRNGKIIAFANVFLGAGKEEISIDLMRYLPKAPQAAMEYLFVELILWSKREGYQWFNLGVAPLSGLEDRTLTSAWNRFGAFLFQYGKRFYNFQGLCQYKEKFAPA